MKRASAQPGLSLSTTEDAARGRLALSPSEAADALGCSRTFFDEFILPELRVVRRGRESRRGQRVFVPIVELERWLAREAAISLESQR